MKARKIVTDDYEFANLIRGGAVYVDKTDLLARLASGRDGSQFFIARPRRFGKSLMLSTLHHLFAGDRDLFRGLKIEKTKWDWSKTYPVLHLDMSEVCGETPEDIEAGLCSLVGNVADAFGLAHVPTQRAGRFFGNVLKALSAKYGQFVVLVDEYDVPLQGFLDDRRAILRVRKTMHEFYVQLKRHVGSIRFLMMTGVSKFTRLSVFSSLNNLTDLTMDEPRYAGLLGYTRNEIKTYFADEIAALGRKRGVSSAKALDELLGWYDSYRFCPDSSVRVCNPISVGKALRSGRLISYWVKTASSSLLVERMRVSNVMSSDFENLIATRDELDVCDAVEMPLVPLMYQAGYVTIKGKSKTEKDEYGGPKLILGIPNHEVRGALKGAFWHSLMQIDERSFAALVRVAERQIAAGDVEGLIGETLYQLYAKLPPTWAPKTEAEAKRHFLLFMEMAGARMQAERPSARGFADAVVETRRGVWVFEFKFNRSAASAIRQIRERGYADAWRGDRRPVTLVGIKFDPAKRNIEMPRLEKMRGER